MVEPDTESSSTLILKTVKELLPLKFFVDKYQRGYKWQPRQVEDLLRDIDEFDPCIDESDPCKGFYCLQPVVVKLHDAEKREWELIDGQQRITTIYMILTYLGHERFHIDYQTRNSSAEFLDAHLKDLRDYHSWRDFVEKNKKLNNVDNYHFYAAFKAIGEWFQGGDGVRKSKEEIAQWKKKLLNHTKVIWYVANAGDQATAGQNSIDIFMRINSGKIRLTNAELIKALLLHSAAVSGDPAGELRQLEMAHQWDAIECQLQRNEFWYFLAGGAEKDAKATRIEFVFDLICEKRTAKNNDDEFYAFNYYSKKLNESEDKGSQAQELWREVRQCYNRLLGWYENYDLYHLAGFIIARKIELVESLWEMAKDKGKLEFRDGLKNIIGKELNKYFLDKDSKEYLFSKLQYNENNREIMNVLILFNIDAHKVNRTRLPFLEYGRQSWSLEHIHAQRSKTVSEKYSWEDWYKDAKSFLDSDAIPKDKAKELGEVLDTYNGEIKGNPNEVGKVTEKYQAELEGVVGGVGEDDMHRLDNLALLSRELNSSIGNEIFSIKRLKLIEHAKGVGKDKEGTFIPIATKNVFSKYYSENVSEMYRWSKEDRTGYREALIDCFKKYPGMEGLK